jgi:putative N6-adenine-specific DNA methylase
VSSVAPQRIFAACAPGLEPVLARELATLGLAAHPVAGGAEAAGEDAVAVACLGSRVADAVKLRAWEGPAAALAAARRDVVARFPGSALEARREGGRATLSVDAAGAPLFRRGWRARVGAAPLRESLAAGLLLHLGYDGSVPFLDPMCGSGTIAIEAALIAARRAPGLGAPARASGAAPAGARSGGRRFAFEGWPEHDPARAGEVRARLARRQRDPPAPVLASDRNGGAVRMAGRNAEAAGVAGLLRIERRDAAAVVPPPGPGLCLVNPPYGVRLGEAAEESWRALAALLARLAGWKVGVLAGSAALARLLPAPADEPLEVRNGGLRCRLLVFGPGGGRSAR